MTKDTFYIFKKPKKYNNALDKIEFDKISIICLPSDEIKLFIIIDKENKKYHYKTNDKQKWIDLIIENHSDIEITASIDDITPSSKFTNINRNNSSNSAISSMSTISTISTVSTTEITTNANLLMIDDEIEDQIDLSIAPIFDYPSRNNNILTDSEIEITSTIENYDYAILEEVEFFVIDLVNGYLRQLFNKIYNDKNDYIQTIKTEKNELTLKSTPQNIQDLCTLFYFVRKFDTRRLRRDCDF